MSNSWWNPFDDDTTTTSATPNQFNTSFLKAGATQSPSKGSVARNQFTTSALNEQGKAVTQQITNSPTNPWDGLKSKFGDIGNQIQSTMGNNLGTNFAGGSIPNLNKGLKIADKTTMFDGTKAGTAMGLNVASKVLGMLASSKKQKQAFSQDMGFSGKADAAVPNVAGAIANANVHDDLQQYV